MMPATRSETVAAPSRKISRAQTCQYTRFISEVRCEDDPNCCKSSKDVKQTHVLRRSATHLRFKVEVFRVDEVRFFPSTMDMCIWSANLPLQRRSSTSFCTSQLSAGM